MIIPDSGLAQDITDITGLTQAQIDDLAANAQREANTNPLIVVSIVVGIIRILSNEKRGKRK